MQLLEARDVGSDRRVALALRCPDPPERIGSLLEGRKNSGEPERLANADL